MTRCATCGRLVDQPALKGAYCSLRCRTVATPRVGPSPALPPVREDARDTVVVAPEDVGDLAALMPDLFGDGGES